MARETGASRRRLRKIRKRIADVATKVAANSHDQQNQASEEHDARAEVTLSLKPPEAYTQDNPLLRLPPELRNRIYETVLINKGLACVNTSMPTHLNCSDPALLKVCRQIREEAMPVFYGANYFYAHFDRDMFAWLRKLGKRRCEMLRSIFVVTFHHHGRIGHPNQRLAHFRRFQKRCTVHGISLGKDVLRGAWKGASRWHILTETELVARKHEEERQKSHEV